MSTCQVSLNDFCFHVLNYTEKNIIDCFQVHKETIDKIPCALPNRGSTDLEVYGMEGIPDEDLRAHEAELGIGGKWIIVQKYEILFL